MNGEGNTLGNGIVLSNKIINYNEHTDILKTKKYRLNTPNATEHLF